jgi:hypothetical protein
MFSVSTFKRISRIALLAMLWQLIALPLSGAVAAKDRLPGEVPVCTASGIKWIKFADQAPVQEEHQQRGHCPLCVTGQGSAALLDSHAAIVVPLSFAREAGFAAFPSSNLPAVFAAPPPARAPPLFS